MRTTTRFSASLWPRLLFSLASALLTCAALFAQSGPAASATPEGKSPAEFAAAADEVLQQMSDITGLTLRSPVKKTLRSRDEIRAYVLRQMNDDKNPAERYADTRAAEAFGLLPKGFDMDTFLVDLLTEQIAGLYDPKSHEFYIADWIPLADQRSVMAHELTHALEDQHFQIEAWSKGAHGNGDATLAREAVLEGSAMAAMLDYMLAGTGQSLKNLPEFDPSMLMGDMTSFPKLKDAPQFIKDSLIFPYFAGMTFTAAAIKPAGWSALPAVFHKPPLSTQQILHPALYKSGKTPRSITIAPLGKSLGPDWTLLEEDTMGEFGWREVLKQFLGAERAVPLAAEWEGDHYILYEHKQSKKLVLAVRLHLSSEPQAARFFGQYSEALEKKYSERTNLFRRPDLFSFDTPDGGVFLRCVVSECVTLEGADRKLFLQLNGDLKWPPVPEQPQKPAADPTKVALQRPHDAVSSDPAP